MKKLKNKSNLKNKKAEVFEMSFSMIFSIILMAVFIAAAFFGIRMLINYQRNIQIGIYLTDLQNDINTAWYSSSEYVAPVINKGYLPAGVEYVCFINWENQTIGANNVEKNLYDEIRKTTVDYSQNFYIYAPTENYAIKAKEIKHVDLSRHSPICIKVIGNQASIKIIKHLNNPLVEVSE